MLQVNLQHKQAAMDALWLKVKREGVDVVFIQEPYVVNKDWLPGLPKGYARAIAPQPVDDDGVAIGSQLAAIVYRKTLPMLQDGEMTDRRTAAVVLKACPPIYLVSTYMPGEVGGRTPYQTTGQKHNWGRLRRRMILACDTNAHSSLWYSKSEDRREGMEVFAIQQGLAVMNRRSRFTTYDGSRGATNIDVVLAGEDLGGRVSGWRVVPEQSDCDHNYVQFDLGLGGEVESSTREIALYSHRKMDIQKLQEEVQRGLQAAAERGALLEAQPRTEGEVDRQVEVLTEVLWEAFTAATPKRRRPLWKRSVPWWTEELGLVKKAFYRARKLRRRSGWHKQEYQKMAVEWKRAMRRAKADSWKKFCSEVDNPWDMIHKILKGERPSPVSTIKDAGGQVIADPQESVQAMVDGFWPD
ncbi:unnamed protein product, partial [Heterosigma akashiwo]